MELLDNYYKSLNELLLHIGFKHGTEYVIVDYSDLFWHLASGRILYYRERSERDDPYSSILATKKTYDKRVFGGNLLTGVLTGPITNEVLLIFDNLKYTGNAKAERKFV